MQQESLIGSGISKRSLASIAIVAVLARIAMVLFLENTTRSWGWDKPDLLMEYGIIAKNMLAGLGHSYTWGNLVGKWFVLPTAYMPPGQTYIDYACFALFGNAYGSIAVYSINLICSVMSIFVIAKIAQALFNSKRVTLITLWMVALYPPFLYSTATFGVTTIVILLQSWVLLSSIRFVALASTAQKANIEAVQIGIGFGLLFLFRGEAPLYAIVTIIMILYTCRKNLRVIMPKLVLATIISVAILAPWTIRNYIVFDRIIPISSNGGFNFWRGNNAQTTGSPWTSSGGPLWSTDELWQKIEPYLDSGALFDKMHSSIHTQAATDWITEHPSSAMILWAKKVLIFWTFDTNSIMGGTITYMTMYALTLLLFAIGLFNLLKKHFSFGIKLILAWCIVATLVAMVFFPLPRLQVIVIASYFPIIAFAVATISDKLRKKQTIF